MSAKICVVGSSNIDLTWRVPRLPKLGETLVGHSFHLGYGGKGAKPRPGDVYFSYDAPVERFGELSGPPVLVFQDLDQPVVAATFGELMCTTYKSFGAVGLITSGAGRDLDQVRRLDFPVFSNGTICSHGYAHVLQVHVPVHVGGIVVYPNDLIHGDRNGVTTIPVEIASEVADVAPEFTAAEAVILKGLRENPNPTVQLLKELRAESKAQIEKLRARVSRARGTQP